MNFKKQLEMESFKRELPVFLAKDWRNNFYKTLLERREVYLGVMGECNRYFLEEGELHVESVSSLSCNHPEADTRVILHMIEADKSTPGDIVIRSSDTDILVLLLHHIHRVSSTVWMHVGAKGQCNLRSVNINKVAAAIGQTMCAALPGFHAFTGCDYTSCFARKGKNRPYAIVSKSDKFQRAFASLSRDMPTDEVISSLQDFVCNLYGARKSIPLNKHRFNMVEKTYKPKSNAKCPFTNLKSIAGSSIPPCEAELMPHIDRSAFVARMWGSAYQKDLEKTPENGWEYINNNFRFIWFNGDQMPNVLVSKISVETDARRNDCDDQDNCDSVNDVDENLDPLRMEMESSDEDEDYDGDH